GAAVGQAIDAIARDVPNLAARDRQAGDPARVDDARGARSGGAAGEAGGHVAVEEVDLPGDRDAAGAAPAAGATRARDDLARPDHHAVVLDAHLVVRALLVVARGQRPEVAERARDDRRLRPRTGRRVGPGGRHED